MLAVEAVVQAAKAAASWWVAWHPSRQQLDQFVQVLAHAAVQGRCPALAERWEQPQLLGPQAEYLATI